MLGEAEARDQPYLTKLRVTMTSLQLYIRSRSQTSCFHSGSLQPVAEVWLI